MARRHGRIAALLVMMRDRISLMSGGITVGQFSNHIMVVSSARTVCAVLC
jgi:hypothetical protein